MTFEENFDPSDYLSDLYAETASPSPLDDPELNARIANAYDVSGLPWYRNVKTQTMIVGVCAIPVTVLTFSLLNAAVTPKPKEVVQATDVGPEEESVAEQLDKERTANALFDLGTELNSEDKDTAAQPTPKTDEPDKPASVNKEPVTPPSDHRATVSPAARLPIHPSTPPSQRNRVPQSSSVQRLPLVPPERAITPTFTRPDIATNSLVPPTPASPVQVVTYRANRAEMNNTAINPTSPLDISAAGYQQATLTKAMARVILPEVVLTENSPKTLKATLTEDFDDGATLIPAGSQLTLSARVDAEGLVVSEVLSAATAEGIVMDMSGVRGLKLMASGQHPLMARQTTTLGNEIADNISQSIQRSIGEAFNEADVLQGIAPDIPIVSEILESTVETTLSHAEARAKVLAVSEPTITWHLPAGTSAFLIGEQHTRSPALAPSVVEQPDPLPVAPAPVTQLPEPIAFGQPLPAPSPPPEPVLAPAAPDTPRFITNSAGITPPVKPTVPQTMAAPVVMPVLTLPVTPGVGRSLVTVDDARIVTAFSSQPQQVSISFDAPLCADGAGGCLSASAQVMHLLVSEAAVLPISITVITENPTGRHVHTVMVEAAATTVETTPVRLHTPHYEPSHTVI